MTREGILGWANNQGDASNDTVFIYYCGHGATDMNADPHPAQRTNGHYFALTRGAPLFRSAIRNGLARSRPRLTILISECCSNVSPIAPLAAPPEMDPGLARSLFLRTQGIVNITAATFDPRTGTDESAWTGPAGGIFTLSLSNLLIGKKVSELDRNQDGLATWAEIFPQVRDATNEEYGEFRTIVLMNKNQYDQGLVDIVNAQTQQRPWSFALDGR